MTRSYPKKPGKKRIAAAHALYAAALGKKTAEPEPEPQATAETMLAAAKGRRLP